MYCLAGGNPKVLTKPLALAPYLSNITVDFDDGVWRFTKEGRIRGRGTYDAYN